MILFSSNSSLKRKTRLMSRLPFQQIIVRGAKSGRNAGKMPGLVSQLSKPPQVCAKNAFSSNTAQNLQPRASQQARLQQAYNNLPSPLKAVPINTTTSVQQVPAPIAAMTTNQPIPRVFYGMDGRIIPQYNIQPVQIPFTGTFSGTLSVLEQKKQQTDLEKILQDQNLNPNRLVIGNAYKAYQTVSEIENLTSLLIHFQYVGLHFTKNTDSSLRTKLENIEILVGVVVNGLTNERHIIIGRPKNFLPNGYMQIFGCVATHSGSTYLASHGLTLNIRVGSEFCTGKTTGFQFITPPLDLVVRNYNPICKSLLDHWSTSQAIALIKAKEDNQNLNVKKHSIRDIQEQLIIDVAQEEKLANIAKASNYNILASSSNGFSFGSGSNGNNNNGII